MFFFLLQKQVLHISESASLQSHIYYSKHNYFCKKHFLNFRALQGEDAFCFYQVLLKLFTHFYTLLSIEFTAEHQVKVTDNISRWKLQTNNDAGDIFPTRTTYIRKNQCHTSGEMLSLAAFSAICQNFMLSMTHALPIKNRTRPSTQKEQHYFLFFSAISLPKEDLCSSTKVISYVIFGEHLILQ